MVARNPVSPIEVRTLCGEQRFNFASIKSTFIRVGGRTAAKWPRRGNRVEIRLGCGDLERCPRRKYRSGLAGMTNDLALSHERHLEIAHVNSCADIAFCQAQLVSRCGILRQEETLPDRRPGNPQARSNPSLQDRVSR